jgi:hypothetical protein
MNHQTNKSSVLMNHQAHTNQKHNQTHTTHISTTVNQLNHMNHMNQPQLHGALTTNNHLKAFITMIPDPLHISKNNQNHLHTPNITHGQLDQQSTSHMNLKYQSQHHGKDKEEQESMKNHQ